MKDLESSMNKTFKQEIAIFTTIIVVGLGIIIYGEIINSPNMQFIGGGIMGLIFPLLFIIPKWLVNREFNKQQSKPGVEHK